MMLRELTESYSPEEILFRGEQVERITNLFKTFKKYGLAENIFIQGFSGSGKTSTITNVFNKVGNNSFIQASGSQSHTCYKLLKALFDLNCNTLERAMADGIKKLKESPKIIIIDEINKLKNNDEIKQLFNTLNTIHRETDCPIIILTNISVNHLNQIMPDDARLTLSFEIVRFPSYTPQELVGILESRLNLIKKKNSEINIPEGRINYIAAMTKSEAEGSARESIIITRKCILQNDFSDENVLKCIEGILEQDEKDFLLNIPETERRFLKAIVEIRDLNIVLNSSNFFKVLLENSTIFKSDENFGMSRISQIISSFDEHRFLTTETENLGRSGGLRRKIKLNKDYLNKIENLIE
jgi:Cdc6-like AAA superfamily ATPase